MLKNQKIYFVSDFHLGIPDYASSLKREKLLVRWLNEIIKDAKEIYLMGDIFDFWFEYKTVIPKGYVRLLGKLAEITDSGIPVHLFRGNHDIWA
ncbi:MAG: metallophosphoesterase, partial [Bacteroidetes bacterium]|nr:metallophosphoesterase [Bacteroidota bacterium]